MINESVPNWEAAKENVLPAKRGRAVKGLKDITVLKCSTEAQENDKENERFKQRLVQCHDLSEKLDIYVMYVKWARDNFPNEANKEKKVLEVNLVSLVIYLSRRFDVCLSVDCINISLSHYLEFVVVHQGVHRQD